MNRKWLLASTTFVLLLGSALLRAQSPPPQPPADDPAQIEWVAGEVFDVPFTVPLDPDAEPLPLQGEAQANVLYFYGPDAATALALGEPELPLGFPFPEPGPQGPPPPGPGPAPLTQSISFVGPDPQDTITFVGFEAGLGGQAVVGAPYSAQVISEFQQTLQDGNKIERKTTTTVYRDGQGRTRREQSLPAIGSYSASGEAPRAIFINDPVAGVNYVLDPARKTARKMPQLRGALQRRAGPPPGNPPQGAAPQGNPPRPQRGVRIQRPNRDADVTSESLGSQTMEGLLVQGTRTTRTIPAGAVGNQQPIQTIREVWYSPELQLNVSAKYVDPMRGTNSTTLTNIRRDEPDASLFQVPADYTVQEMPNRMRGTRMPPRAPQQ